MAMFIKEDFERFVKMLDERQIIVIRADIIGRKYPHFKIIGANDGGKWDFTPLVVEAAKCQSIPIVGREIAICGTLDVVSNLQDALRNLHDERISSAFFDENNDCGYALYSYCNDHICKFCV